MAKYQYEFDISPKPKRNPRAATSENTLEDAPMDDEDEIPFVDNPKDLDFEILDEFDNTPKDKDKFYQLIQLGIQFVKSDAQCVAFLNSCMRIADRPDLMMCRRTFGNHKKIDLIS